MTQRYNRQVQAHPFDSEDDALEYLAEVLIDAYFDQKIKL